MGQRLVVTITLMGGDVAKLYYHWSAYSISALEETKKIVNHIASNAEQSIKTYESFIALRNGSLIG